MNILSWNVAGLRARLKKGDLNFLNNYNFDILCFQETKALPEEVEIPSFINKVYPNQYWNSNIGITQKKGFSGTTIWSKIKPIKKLETPEFDLEGRTITLEFVNFYLVTVYTPNSQSKDSERNNFRIKEWDPNFKEYLYNLNKVKKII